MSKARRLKKGEHVGNVTSLRCGGGIRASAATAYKLKVNQSIHLIKNSHHSLTEIALLCGFADQSHFTGTFKGLTGFLPTDFKKL